MSGLRGLPPRETTPDEKANFLEDSSWVKGLEWDDVKKLARYITVYDVPSNHEAIEEGTKHAAMGLVVKGSVQVVKQTGDEGDKVLCTLGKGKTFGEISIIDGGLSSASIVTNEPLTLVVLTAYSLELLIKEEPAVAARLVLNISKVLTEKLRHTSGRLVDYLGE